MKCLTNVRSAAPHEKIKVTLPHGGTIESTHIGELQVGPSLARKTHVFQGTLGGYLLSIELFCDQN